MHKKKGQKELGLLGGGPEAWERRSLVPLVGEFRKTI